MFWFGESNEFNKKPQLSLTNSRDMIFTFEL